MYQVAADKINKRQPLDTMDALDIFAREGDWHSAYLTSRVKNLTAWEVKEAHEAKLRQNFPEADVKICDSYEEIKRTDKIFDLVVIDNNLLGTTHVEHFDLYPQLFRILKPRAFVVQNVIPDPYMYRPMVADEVQKRRKEFYSSSSDIVPLPYIIRRYHILATKNGHIVRWDHVSPWNGGGVFTHMMEILHA